MMNGLVHIERLSSQFKIFRVGRVNNIWNQASKKLCAVWPDFILCNHPCLEKPKHKNRKFPVRSWVNRKPVEKIVHKIINFFFFYKRWYVSWTSHLNWYSSCITMFRGAKKTTLVFSCLNLAKNAVQPWNYYLKLLFKLSRTYLVLLLYE
jgi:hypothetical protein